MATVRVQGNVVVIGAGEEFVVKSLPAMDFQGLEPVEARGSAFLMIYASVRVDGVDGGVLRLCVMVASHANKHVVIMESALLLTNANATMVGSVKSAKRR